MANHLYQQQKYWHWCTGMSLLLQLRMGSAKKSNLICVSRSFMLHFVSGEHWGLKLCKINTLTRFKGLKAETVLWLHLSNSTMKPHEISACSASSRQISADVLFRGNCYHSIRDVLYRDVTLRNMDAGEQNVPHTRRQRHTSGAKTQMQWVGEVKKRKCLGVFNRLHGHKPCGHSCSHTCLLFLSSPPVCVNDSLTLERKVIKAEFHFKFHSQSVDLLHRNPLCAASNSLSLTFIQ